MLNQNMEPSEIMDLYFTKYDTFQNLWVIYATAFFGLIAYFSSQPKFITSRLRRNAVIMSFLIFGLANCFSLLKNKSDMENIKNASTVSLVADDEQLIRSYLLPVVDNEDCLFDYITNHWLIFLFHLVFDFIMIYIIIDLGDKEVEGEKKKIAVSV